jgi:nucleotide-binding universal stress UspA family protein
VAGGVICALDRSSTATRVAAAASDVAEQLGLRLVVAYGGEDPTTAVADGGNARPSSVERAEAFLEGVAAAASLHRAELRVELGDPVETLLDLAAHEDAELMVVGRSGNIWHDLVMRAACPVLVVPAQQEAAPMGEARRETSGDPDEFLTWGSEP